MSGKDPIYLCAAVTTVRPGRRAEYCHITSSDRDVGPVTALCQWQLPHAIHITDQTGGVFSRAAAMMIMIWVLGRHSYYIIRRPCRSNCLTIRYLSGITVVK